MQLRRAPVSYGCLRCIQVNLASDANTQATGAPTEDVGVPAAGGISGVMTVNTHAALRYRYEAHGV